MLLHGLGGQLRHETLTPADCEQSEMKQACLLGLCSGIVVNQLCLTIVYAILGCSLSISSSKCCIYNRADKVQAQLAAVFGLLLVGIIATVQPVKPELLIG